MFVVLDFQSNRIHVNEINSCLVRTKIFKKMQIRNDQIKINGLNPQLIYSIRANNKI